MLHPCAAFVSVSRWVLYFCTRQSVTLCKSMGVAPPPCPVHWEQQNYFSSCHTCVWVTTDPAPNWVTHHDTRPCIRKVTRFPKNLCRRAPHASSSASFSEKQASVQEYATSRQNYRSRSLANFSRGSLSQKPDSQGDYVSDSALGAIAFSFEVGSLENLQW